MASITSHSVAETFALGRDFAATLQRGDMLALAGDLGAGKTHFVQGLAAGLGIMAEVASPTFALIHEHSGGRLPLFHIDCYRLETADELLAIGIEEYLPSHGVTAIEWADKFPELLPASTRWIRFTIGENDTREIEIPSRET